MTMKTYLFTLILLGIGLHSFAQEKWALDKSHSKIGFSVLHMGISEVEGYFKDFESSVTTSNNFQEADITFVAKAASIYTDNERRDTHLKSDDFFNAEKFPELKFTGKLVKENNAYSLKGKLTIRDVTKDVVFKVVYGGRINTGRGEKAGFKISGEINRLDYGLKWENKLSTGEWVVSEKVDLICKIELNLQP